MSVSYITFFHLIEAGSPLAFLASDFNNDTVYKNIEGGDETAPKDAL